MGMNAERNVLGQRTHLHRKHTLGNEFASSGSHDGNRAATDD